MTTWQESDRKRSKGPWIALAIAVLVIVALAVTLLVIIGGRDDTAAPRSSTTSNSPSVAPSTNDPGPGLVGAFTDLRYAQVGGVPIPTSPTLGPLTVNTDGTATKYAHSQAGAVVAAINLIARTSGLVPATVYEPTIANQTVGDDAAKQQTVTQATKNSAALTAATAQYTTQVVGYRIDGPSTTDDVRTTLLSRATDATDPSMHALLQQGAEVPWQNGDWKFLLPSQEGAPVSAAPGGRAAFPGQTLTPLPQVDAMCNILLSPICGIDDAAGGVANAVGGSFIDSVSDSAGKAAGERCDQGPGLVDLQRVGPVRLAGHLHHAVEHYADHGHPARARRAGRRGLDQG